MISLNLDPQFIPLGPGITFKKHFFNGGEPHIQITEQIDPTLPLTITTRISEFNHLGELLVATDALRRLGIETINLILPYFPGARQDRIMNPGEPLTVKVYADLINGANFNRVTIFDPHSDVTSALINRVKIIPNHLFIQKIAPQLNDYCLVAPDAGAQKKIYQLAKTLGGVPVVEAGKKRDVATGQLSGFKVYADDLGGKTCLVVDDICDGGGTFLGLAQQLKQHNCGKLILAVSHGIFSRGLDDLTSIYDHVFCTDSFKTLHSKGLTQIQLDKNILK